MTNNSLVICADIGGTHITTALVDLRKKAIVPGSYVRGHINSHANATEIVDTWSQAIAASAKNAIVDKLSIAMPGPFDYEKGISLMKGQGKYDSIYKFNVKELLAERLGMEKENIFFVNDAASFLQGEVFAGAALGFERAIGITLGTGFGSCVFENDKAVDAGLWRMPFDEGIAEDYLCTRWFVKRYYELSAEKITGVSELINIENEFIRQQIFDEFGSNLARVLLQFIAMRTPQVAVIGGNIAKAYCYFKKALIPINSEYPKVAIKVAELGEDAALLGAASYYDTHNSMDVHN